jgi:hypothetical protein
MTIGNVTHYWGNTTGSSPQTHIVSRPTVGITVRFLNDVPEGIFAFDAARMRDIVKAEYRIE